ncbi:MAG: CoA transferase, partial [Gemmatimonadales bacterium]
MRGTPGVITLLAETHVLELGDGIAGASAAAILASLGARVTKRIRQGDEPPPFEPSLETSAGRVSILTALLDRDKVVEATPEEPWAAELPDADVVICDRVVDGAGPPADDARYGEVVSRTKRGAWVTLSPFGLTGPYAGYRGSELVASAAGGLSSTIVPQDGGRPTLLPGWQGLLTTGHVAALAALHGLDESRRRRRSVHVDVSSQEAVAMAGALPECAHAIYACP